MPKRKSKRGSQAMSSKITIEADSNNDLLNLLSNLISATSVSRDDMVHDDIVDIQEELTRQRTKLSNMDDQIRNIGDTFNEFSIKSNVGCKHHPAIVTCDNLDGPYNGTGALLTLKSWEASGERLHYRLDGQPCTISVYLCKKCNQLFAVTEYVRE